VLVAIHRIARFVHVHDLTLAKLVVDRLVGRSELLGDAVEHIVDRRVRELVVKQPRELLGLRANPRGTGPRSECRPRERGPPRRERPFDPVESADRDPGSGRIILQSGWPQCNAQSGPSTLALSTIDGYARTRTDAAGELSEFIHSRAGVNARSDNLGR